MKTFAFSLQKYLDVKKDDEEILTKQLKNIDSSINEIDRIIRDCDDQEKAEKQKLENEYKDGIAAQDLHKFSAFFNYMYETKKEKNQQLKEEMARKEECREQLIKVMNEIKALDKMKQRQYEEYKEALKLEENKVIDDFVSYQAFTS